MISVETLSVRPSDTTRLSSRPLVERPSVLPNPAFTTAALVGVVGITDLGRVTGDNLFWDSASKESSLLLPKGGDLILLGDEGPETLVGSASKLFLEVDRASYARLTSV